MKCYVFNLFYYIIWKIIPVPAVSTTAPVVPGVRNGDSAAGPGGKRKTKRKLKSKKYK